MAQMPEERRSENRIEAKDYYRAEIRLVGVPVYEVKIKDLSSKGACILVKDNSSLLHHLEIGQIVTVKFYLEDRSKPTEMFAAKIIHISEVENGRFKGHISAGLSIL